MSEYHIKVRHDGQIHEIIRIPYEENSVSISFEFPFTKTIQVKGQYYAPKKELTWNAYELHELGYRELSVEELCVIVD